MPNNEQQQNPEKDNIQTDIDNNNNMWNSDKQGYVIDPKNFLLPEMGDYYLGYLDNSYLKKLNDMVYTETFKPKTEKGEQKSEQQKEEENKNKTPEQIEKEEQQKKEQAEKDAKKAAYYTEEPPFENFGSFKDVNYFYANITIDQKDIDYGIVNSSTLYLNINSIEGDTDNKILNSLQRLLNISSNDTDYIFYVKLLGIDDTHKSKWGVLSTIDLEQAKTELQTETYKQIKDNHIFVASIDHQDDDKIDFITIGQKKHEIKHSIDQSCYLVCLDKGTQWVDDSIIDTNIMKQLIENAGGRVYFVLDNIPSKDIDIKNDSDYICRDPDTSDFINKLTDISGDDKTNITSLFFRTIKEPIRYLTGKAYIQINHKWINLTKALLAHDDAQCHFNTLYNGVNPDIFKVDFYDPNAIQYTDNFINDLEKLDDRKIIQKEIFGKDLLELNDWTVTIGDVTLFVPPTNITVSSSINNTYVPLLRAKGSMSKTGQHSDKILHMSIYFNEDRGINGYKYNAKYPNQKDVTYKMNGLRALISQFKFCPFLPINNKYINETLGIDAIVVTALSVSSMENYPKTLKVEFTCKEFDYITYMPDLLNGIDLNQKEYHNFFADSINWVVMRYYYQKPLLYGDDMAIKKYNFLSQEFVNETLKNRTMLIPMNFKDPSLKFYIADKTYLDQLLSIYEDSQRMIRNGITFDNKKKDLLLNLSKIKNEIEFTINTPNFNENLSLINSMESHQIVNHTSILNNGRYDSDTCQEILDTPIFNSDKEKTYISKCLHMLYDNLNEFNKSLDTSLIKNMTYSTETRLIEQNVYKVYFNLKIELNTNNDQDDYEQLGESLSTFIETDADRTLHNNCIIVPISCLLTSNPDAHNTSNDSLFNPDNYDPYNYLDYQKGSFGVDYKDDDMIMLDFSTNASLHDTLSKINDLTYKTTENIPFVPFDAGNIIVKNYNVSLTNHITDIYLKDIDGSAPQFLGGEDILFSVVLETTDLKTVSSLSQLPQMVASFSRRYKKIMPCYPLKIESEFSKFFGVFEVTIENVQTMASSNNNPVHTIILTLRSVDRTYRSREALRRIEIDNAGKQFSEEIHTKQVRSYFDIQKVLAKAELYPDLELPTIKELEDLGFYFTRYKFQDFRTYVDPDFYYIYTNRLTSQIIRESLINSGKAGKELNSTLVDSSGGSIDIQVQKKTGYTVTSKNNIVQNQESIAKQYMDNIYKQKSEEVLNNWKDKLKYEPDKDKENGGIQENWTICNNIKSILLEYEQKKAYDVFVREAIKAGKTKEEFYNELINKQKEPGNTNTDAKNNNQENKQNIKESEERKQELQKEKIQFEQNDKQKIDIPTDEKEKENIITTGLNIYSKLEKARKTSNDIQYYLQNTPIDAEVYETTLYMQKNITDIELKNIIYKTVSEFFHDKTISTILDNIDIKINNLFIPIVQDIIYACACSQTGEKEYSNKNAATEWRPNKKFIGIRIKNDSQDLSGKDTITPYDNNGDYKATVQLAIKEAVDFSIFRIKQYDRNTISNITKEDIYNPWNNASSINTTHYLIDPYYRYELVETIEQYKQGCITNPKYATIAFLRICLYWLKRLIDIQAIPSYVYDIMSGSINQELENQKKLEEILNKTTEDGAELNKPRSISKEHLEFIQKNKYVFDTGKIWLGAILSIIDGDSNIFERINQRDYRGLNGYFQGCVLPSTTIDSKDTTSMAIRKTAFALVGLGRIKDFDALGIKQNSVGCTYKRNTLEKIYIDAADDPSIYIPHSCHDMIVHDARGRMLRAFPTFYMLIMDEGRTIGQWKLHDNFYNNMCIMDMQIVKSRKIAADTANITMSNFFKTFTEDNSDLLNVQEASFDDVFDSILSPVYSPERIFKKQENRRKKSPVSSATKLQPGVRIHIRMGYGSNANMLPPVFNGVIAELDVQDTVNIIAQGDGIELMNPIMDDDDAYEIKEKDTFTGWSLANKGTPKSIMNSILTTHGGFLADWLKDGIWDGRYMAGLINSNPYGIVHFGDRDYKDIIRSGEPTQNIFEACAKPAWGDEKDITMEYCTDEVPEINFELLGKTVWDVANICRSVTPDFICAVSPFEFRSTLFIGHPRYYYAYAYYLDGSTVMERRKPYQQFHIYTSGTDIISNKIKVSSQEMKTAALGLYQIAENFNIKSQKRIGPIYADADIFPEFQKTMIVDTQLYGKGAPIIGCLLTNLVTNDWLDDVLGGKNAHAQIAWRMTASALKDSMKEMYGGDLIVLGDPSVKPHDRLYIDDNYTGIRGQCLVKEVVHTFSINEGFTTTISPDLIGVVDDPFETAVQQIFSSTGSIATTLLKASATYGMMSLIAKRAITVGDFASFAQKMIPEPVVKMLQESKGNIANIAKEVGPTAKNAKAILTGFKIIKGTAEIGGAIVTGATAATLGGLIASILTALTLFDIGFTLIGNYLSNTIFRFLKNKQAMQIFPLKKNNTPFTAGVMGSQGFIYGSPSYNKQGTMTKFLSDLLGDDDSSSNLVKLIKGFFVDEAIQDIANKNMHSLKILDSDNNAVRSEKQFQSIFGNSVQKQSNAVNDYRMLQSTKLVSSQEEKVVAYNKYSILDDNFQNNSKLSNNTLLSESTALKYFIDEKFLLILHDSPGLNKGELVDTQLISINGQDRYIKVIKSKSKDDLKIIYDIPFLNPNAILVLAEVLRREKNKMPPANTPDQYENYDYTKNSFILFKSGLKVNDPDTMSSTGFCFILEPYGNVIEFFEPTIKEFYDELKNTGEQNEILNSTLFEYKKLDHGNEYAFTVIMPSTTA